ncbi:L-aspartate oxidase [Bacillus mesophilus]|nr:L-aspartate oxidase [Bacillus mesophilus]MBM7660673.1 L-aspartate oxidase [Bacillus mesophilus]
MPKSDVVIIGSGLAALVAANRLCMEKNVIIFTKSSKYNSNSMLAQGGVAAAISSDDDWSTHFNDTILAGCGHNLESAVKALVQEGPRYMEELIQQGMQFDKDEAGRIKLGQEGAHSIRRILHAGGDATGKALVQFLLKKLCNKVQIIEHELAIDLIVNDGSCVGVQTLDEHSQLTSYYANHVILATGGCGGLYEHSSNDHSIVGDGYAMAYRAGADLIDMEFIQFHPTLLYVNGHCPGLISEAVRGEGATLVTKNGRKIMEGQHPLLDLAPRDVVARVIFEEVKKGESIFLDITMIENFSSHFPTITSLCKRNGISPSDGKIPVVPGAHFMMGGIKVDSYSQSTIPGLFAIGEVACTGVHGANRLASNSLLEGIVFSNLMADFILSQATRPVSQKALRDERPTVQSKNQLPTKEEIKEMMMKSVGIVRSKRELEEVVMVLEPYIQLKPKELHFNKEKICLLNMITTAWLIASSALHREESRGGHYRADFPDVNKVWDHRTITRNALEHAVVN